MVKNSEREREDRYVQKERKKERKKAFTKRKKDLNDKHKRNQLEEEKERN